METPSALTAALDRLADAARFRVLPPEDRPLAEELEAVTRRAWEVCMALFASDAQMAEAWHRGRRDGWDVVPRWRDFAEQVWAMRV